MSTIPSRIAGVVVGVLATTHAYSDSSEQLLDTLRAELATIQAASGDEPVGMTSIPEVDALRGTSRDVVRSALGAPDDCGNNESECATQPSWAYWFFYLPPGWRGGGPELWLTFDAGGLVQEAEWKFSR